MNGRERTRTNRLHIACTPAEKKRIEQEAKRCGMTVTDLIVIRCSFPRDMPKDADLLQGAKEALAEQSHWQDEQEPDYGPPAALEAIHDSKENPKDFQVLETDGVKVRCCRKCYVLHGQPRHKCKTCLQLNGKV